MYKEITQKQAKKRFNRDWSFYRCHFNILPGMTQPVEKCIVDPKWYKKDCPLAGQKEPWLYMTRQQPLYLAVSGHGVPQDARWRYYVKRDAGE